MLTRRRGLGERGDKILRWRHSNCTHYDACRRETAECSQRRSEVRAGRLSSRFRLRAYRAVHTRPVSSRSVHHGIFPDVYFYTHSLQRPHERRPMASRREQVSALFFAAWTQRRLTECFSWATEGPNPPKETLTFKKDFFWQTTSGSLPAGLNDRADIDIIGFYAWPTKANKNLDKDLQSLPTQTARHVSGRSRWKHNPAELRELSARVTDPSGPVLPSCSHKHEETFESNVGRRETCLLAMRVGLDQSRFPGSHVTPGAPARKEVFETALEGPARTQSDVFLVFSRTGNPLVRTVFLRGQRKLTKNSSTHFTLLATIVTIVAEQLNFDAQEAQYTTKTTTPVATEGDEEKKQNSEFSLVYFLALFLSRFKCAFCQRSLRQRRDALKSLLRHETRRVRVRLTSLVKHSWRVEKTGDESQMSVTSKKNGAWTPSRIYKQTTCRDCKPTESRSWSNKNSRVLFTFSGFTVILIWWFSSKGKGKSKKTE